MAKLSLNSGKCRVTAGKSGKEFYTHSSSENWFSDGNFLHGWEGGGAF